MSQYVGLFEPIKYSVCAKDLAKIYALPNKPCYIFEIYSSEYCNKFEYIKESDEMMVWVPPLVSNV